MAVVRARRERELAQTGTIEAGALLGRTIAHEIGHLLLGTREHARTGLMRAVWSVDAVRLSRPVDWLFTAREARTMREAVRTRGSRQYAARTVLRAR